MGKNLLILLSEEGAEPERVAELTGYLREELLDLDVDDVTAMRAAEVPSGARAVDAAEIGTLLVALGSSVTALDQVVTVVRSWLNRCRDTRPSLRLELDDDVLEVSEATDEQIADAFRIFVRRHAPAGDQP
ncbi:MULTISPECIES: hypothetical protein [Streptomyces]|uniref:hypothetical protein n=1 Tax=Streptomyces TaxID=1883 RepID=UPI001C861140|nr:hypothetical protein [Streptomyces sp. EAS-AB2608]MCE0447469.1 hypothetical protein [Streptomyces tricolor]